MRPVPRRTSLPTSTVLAFGPESIRRYGLGFLVAGVGYWVAYDGGSFAVTSRTTLGAVLWWALFVCVAVGLVPLARIPRPALVTGGLLAAFAVYTGLSAFWAASAEKSFEEFDRVTLYLAVFAVAVVAGRRTNVAGWIAGLALATVAVAFTALASRFFPSLVPQGALLQLLPAVTKRLSYPLNYWNALATLVAFAFPLLLWGATCARNALLRGVALAPLPAVATTIYLTSSRGGAVAAAIGAVVFVVLTPARWRALAAIVFAAAGTAVAVAGILANSAVVDDPFGHAAVAQGRNAAVVVGLACLGTGAIYAAAVAFTPSLAPPRWIGWALVVACVAAVAVGIVAAHPVRRFHDFKQPPPSPKALATASVQGHFFGVGGNYRWQLWQAAIDEFETRPMIGRGAGSYGAWWLEHGSIQGVYVTDAHSLYVETLGELGIVGFVLLLAFLVSGVIVTLVRAFTDDPVLRGAIAGLAGVFAAFLFEAGFDWIWEIPAVGVVPIVALGLLTGPATAEEAAPARPRRRLRVVAALGFVGVALVLAGGQAVPLAAQLNVRESQAALRRGDGEAAVRSARAATAVEPWASSPYLQLAFADEQLGNLGRARAAIVEAIKRDPSDWRLWFVRTRLETKEGRIAAARRSLHHAIQLNPRLPALTGS